jgi:hypothetical protein
MVESSPQNVGFPAAFSGAANAVGNQGTARQKRYVHDRNKMILH